MDQMDSRTALQDVGLQASESVWGHQLGYRTGAVAVLRALWRRRSPAKPTLPCAPHRSLVSPCSALFGKRFSVVDWIEEVDVHRFSNRLHFVFSLVVLG